MPIFALLASEYNASCVALIGFASFKIFVTFLIIGSAISCSTFGASFPAIAFIGALFLCSTMFLNSYSHGDVKPSDGLVNAVMISTAVGMGSDTIDKFSLKKSKDTESES